MSPGVVDVGNRQDAVAEVRGFNRFYTAHIGVLGSGLLDTPYSLTEARTIFELAQQPSTDTADLRTALGIDAGYLSRILGRFEADGLIVRERSAADARRVVLRLSDAGHEAFRTLDERSAAEVAALLEPLLADDRRRLVGALQTIRSILTSAPRSAAFVLRAPEAGDYGWVVERHGVLYAHEYGWDETFEALVARIVADYVEHRDPRREAAWIAEVDGERAGCVFCVRKDEDTAQLRLLLVEPAARGMGIGLAPLGRVPPVRPSRPLPAHRAVDERRARRRPAYLRARGVPADRGGPAPQLRARPGWTELGPRAEAGRGLRGVSYICRVVP